MQEVVFPTTAGVLGNFFGAEIRGNREQEITRLSSLENAKPGSLVFFSDKRFRSQLEHLKNVVLLTSPELLDGNLDLTVLLVPNPRKAFAEVAKLFVPIAPWKGISDKAVIAPSALLASSVHVGPFATICEGAKIGGGTVIYPHAYIGPGVEIGENCEIFPHVALISQVQIGNRVQIFAGSVLGSEGFGFLEGDSGYSPMPQIGKVVIEDDVRIGAKCTVDRSTLGETRIGAGTKIDDQVHIGHNCRIGKNCILCAQVGLAGSTILEDDVILAGQVGLAGHLTVGKGARLGGQTGASTNLKGGETYLSSPAMPIREALLTYKYMRKLPELAQRIRKLEEKLNS